MKKILSVVAALSLVFSDITPALAADPATPTWTEIGAGPIQSNAVNSSTGLEGMPSTKNPSCGAISELLVDPGNTNIIYAGAVNGGVWKTTDGGTSWTPLTDRQSSLSISEMHFDPTDATNKTIIVGIGKTSAFASASGPMTGIQYTTDGGSTWSEKGRTELYGKDITGVAAKGTLMMATVRNHTTPINTVGLYRSTDSGATFSNAVSGLPVGNAHDLTSDPTNTSRFYLSIVNDNDAQTGVYRSDDSGATWRLIKAVTGLTTAYNSANKEEGRIKLSVGASGVLVAQVQQGKTRLDILRTADQGTTWVDMGKPSTSDFTGLFPGGQTEPHGTILADPTDSNVVYAGGDTQVYIPNSTGSNQWTGPVFRGVYDPGTKLTTWTCITSNNTLSSSAPHADSRAFAIDSSGRLLRGDDGGIYVYAYPATTKQYDWTPLIGNLRVNEMTQASWNSITHTVSAAAQDIGHYYQFPAQRGTYTWSSIGGGDGGPGPVNNVTYKGTNISVVYKSSQYLGGFARIRVGQADDETAAATTLTSLYPKLSGTIITGESAGYMSFLSIVALNRKDPRKLALGGKQLFIGTDDLTVDTTNGYSFTVTSLLTPASSAEVTSISYGTNESGANPKDNAMLAGDSGGGLYYTSNAGTTAVSTLSAYTGSYVWSAIFDERDGNRFYVTDSTNVWRSTDAGSTFAKITNNLPTNFVDRRGLAFASSNGVYALFAGGVSNDTSQAGGVYVTRYTSDTSADSATPTWSNFGGSMANAPVYGLSYDSTDDVLLVNLLGRGAWVVYDLTTYFPEATSLIFGNANSDTTATASVLTDGTTLAGTTFSRSVTKNGTGTLTLSGTSTYSGTTTISSGALSITGTGALPGWDTNSKYSVASGTTLAVYNAVTDANITTMLGTTNFASGSAFGFDTTTADRTYSTVLANTAQGALGLTKLGSNTLTLSGTNTYTGVTTLKAGTVSVSTLANGGANSNIGASTNAAANLVFDGGTLQYAGATTSTDRNFTINAGKTATIEVTTAANTLTISGASTSTTGALTKTGAGTLLLSGANTYTGATTVSAGTLKAGVASVANTSGAFGKNSAVTMANVASATMDITGFNTQIGSLTGGGTTGGNVTLGAATLTIGGDNTSPAAYAGAISGTGGITKSGTGTLTLSGTNTYTGTATISGGALSISGTGALPGWNTNGSYSVASGGTLAVYNAVTDANITTMLGTTNFAAGSALGFDTTTADRTYSVVLANTAQGALGLTKLNGNTLTLSGANTYTGTTTVQKGTLSFNTVAAGANPQSLGEGTTLNMGVASTSSCTLQYTGAAGTLDKNINVLGNDYDVLQNSGSGLLTLSGTITRTGTTLTLNGGTYGITVSGKITGTGSSSGLLITGGTTTLTNATNDYAGTTYVFGAATLKNGVANALPAATALTLGEGTYDLNGYNSTIAELSDSTYGSRVVTNNGASNATLTVTGDSAFAGVIQNGSKTTALTKSTGEALILSGANTYTGATTINASCTLQIGNAGTTGSLSPSSSISDNGTLSFNRTNTLTQGTDFATGISGTGTLLQSGSGTLILNSLNSYSGGTTIDAGTLQVSHANAAGTGTLTNNATLDLGTTKLNIGASNYVQATGATLKAAVSGTSSGSIVTTGKFTVGGTDKVVLNVSKYIPNKAAYKILDGGTGLGGIDAPVITTPGYDNALFTATTVGDDLILTASRGESNGFAADAEDEGDPNAAAAGEVLDDIESPTDDMQDVLDTLDGLDDSEVVSSLDTMIPDVSSGAMQASFVNTGQFLGAVSNRLGFVRSGIAQTGIATGDMFHGTGFWMQALGNHTRQATRNGIEGYQANTFGTSIGADKLLGNHVRVGFSGGYGYAHVNSKTGGSPKSDINSFQGTIYGSYDSLKQREGDEIKRGSKGGVRNPGQDSWYLDGMFGFTQNNYSNRREIFLSGDNRVAKSDSYGQQYSTRFESGYTFVFEKTKAFEWTPFISLDYSYLYMNKYKEDGAGALNLTVNGQGFNLLEQGLGTKIAYPIHSKKAGTFIPSVKTVWLHDYMADPYEATASFAGGGPSFETKGAKPARNGMLVGTQLAFLNQGNMTLTGNFDWEIKEQYQSYTYYGTARFDF